MQRLPACMLGTIRPGGPLGSLLKLMLSAAAAGSDAACIPPLTRFDVTPTSAPAGFRTISSMAGPALHSMAVGNRSMRTAAAAVPISCGAACQAAALPGVGRQCFATAAQQAAAPQQQEGISEVTAVKVVKYLVIGMIIVLTVRVMPYMGVGTVQSALQLLTAESPFLQKAGAQRLSALANLSHSGASAAIDGEAIPKLLHLLEHSDDQGVKREVTNALLQLAKIPKGETALLLAEAPLICMLVMDTGDIDDKTSYGLRELMAQLEAAAGKRE